MATLPPQKPVRYLTNHATRGPTKNTLPQVLEPGKVLVVRGRTQTKVFHTWPTCKLLRGVARTTDESYARRYMGLRPCEECSRPHQLTLEAPQLNGVPA